VFEGEVTEQRAGERLRLLDYGLGQGGGASQRGSDHVRNTTEFAQRGRDQLRTLLRIGRVRGELLAHSIVARLHLPGLRDLISLLVS
jgi:hypothetical protein